MKPIGSTKWAEKNFIDKDVEKEKTYYYQIRSVKVTRGVPIESAPSETVSIKVPSVRWQSPENVGCTVERVGIRVNWKIVKIEGHDTRYNVYRSEAGGAIAKINPDPLRNPPFLDSTVRKGTTYRYAVTAFPKDKPDEESSRSGSLAACTFH